MLVRLKIVEGVAIEFNRMSSFRRTDALTGNCSSNRFWRSVFCFSMSKQSVIVIGSAGYINSHACKALAKAGYLPVVYDNLSYGHEWAVKWGPFERGDILDRTRLNEVLARYRPDAVMHFAAFAYIGKSVTDPADTTATRLRQSHSVGGHA